MSAEEYLEIERKRLEAAQPWLESVAEALNWNAAALETGEVAGKPLSASNLTDLHTERRRLLELGASLAGAMPSYPLPAQEAGRDG